jgi:hypothetical protein
VSTQYSRPPADTGGTVGSALTVATSRWRPVAKSPNDRDGVKAATVNHPQGKRMLSVLRETCQGAVNAGRLNRHRLNELTCNHAPGQP